MTDELQADDTPMESVEVTETHSEASEQPETVSESAADSGESHEQKVTFSDEQQAVMDKVVGGKTYKLREAERGFDQERADFKRQLEEMRAQLPQETRPDIPNLPDKYDYDSDADYMAAVQVRDKALTDAVGYDARSQAQQDLQQQQQLKAQQEQQAAFQQKAQTYSERATTLGVKSDELQAAGQMLANAGMSDAMADAILSDDQGPLIAKYAAGNYQALERMLSNNPQVAWSAFNEAKAEASKLRPRTTSAPAPTETLRGNGVAKQNPLLDGVTFD